MAAYVALKLVHIYLSGLMVHRWKLAMSTKAPLHHGSWLLNYVLIASWNVPVLFRLEHSTSIISPRNCSF